MPSSSPFSAEADPILLRDVENPEISGDRLRAISLREDCTRFIREKIAKHPNCPPDLLQQYFPSFPMQAMQNPALPLLLIENPEFFLSLPSGTVVPILEEAETPTWFVEALRRHPRSEVTELAEWHVAVAGDISSDWEYRLNDWFFASIIKSPLGRDHMTELLNLKLVPEKLQSEFSHRLLLFTEEPAAPLAEANTEIVEPKQEDSKEEKEARNPSTSRKRLLELAQSGNPRWHRALAQNPNAPGEVLATIVASMSGTEQRAEQSDILRCVALHPQTSTDTLMTLALLDPLSHVVRTLALRNAELSEPVRLVVIASLRKSRATLAGLWQFSLARVADEAQIAQAYRLNPNWQERLGLALNSELSAPAINELTRDANALVRTVARARQDDPRVPTWFWGNIKAQE
jgi:hypothetical protein